VGWHIDAGQYEGVTLDGLNVALMVYTPGHMMEVPWQVALYLDERADDKQQEALGAIFSGQAGGHLARLGNHIGSVLGAGPAAIEFVDEGSRVAMTIGGVADVAIAAIPGQGGEQITIENHPLVIAPGFPAVACRSEHLTYDDHGFDWKLEEKNGFFAPFEYAA